MRKFTRIRKYFRHLLMLAVLGLSFSAFSAPVTGVGTTDQGYGLLLAATDSNSTVDSKSEADSRSDSRSDARSDAMSNERSDDNRPDDDRDDNKPEAPEKPEKDS